MASLSEIPVIVYSIKKFDLSQAFIQIIVIASQDKEENYKLILEQYHLQTPISLVVGGDSRQSSVFNGLLSLDMEPDIVVIHDGARPLIKADQISEVINAARIHGAASLGVHPKDLIKIDDGHGYAISSIRKNNSWNVQTPQAFRWNDIMGAHKLAAEKKSIFEDDASMLEELGFKIKMVEGTDENIKITTPIDLHLAELIIQQNREFEI